MRRADVPVENKGREEGNLNWQLASIPILSLSTSGPESHCEIIKDGRVAGNSRYTKQPH